MAKYLRARAHMVVTLKTWVLSETASGSKGKAMRFNLGATPVKFSLIGACHQLLMTLIIALSSDHNERAREISRLNNPSTTAIADTLGHSTGKWLRCSETLICHSQEREVACPLYLTSEMGFHMCWTHKALLVKESHKEAVIRPLPLTSKVTQFHFYLD